MPKTYAVTVIKRIAYVETFIIDAESEDDAKEECIEKTRMRAKPMEDYAQKAVQDHEVGSVVQITV